MKAKWENEKNAITKVQYAPGRDRKGQCRDRNSRSMQYDLNKAAELKYGRLPQLQKELEEEEKTR